MQECSPELLPEALGKPGNCRLMAGRFFSTKTCPGSTNFKEGDGTVFVMNVFRMVGNIEPNFSRQTKRTTAGGPGAIETKARMAFNIEPVSLCIIFRNGMTLRREGTGTFGRSFLAWRSRLTPMHSVCQCRG
jgi:hypothetical protein